MVHFLLGGIVPSCSTSLLTGSEGKRQSGSLKSIFPSLQFYDFVRGHTMSQKVHKAMHRCFLCTPAFLFLFSPASIGLCSFGRTKRTRTRTRHLEDGWIANAVFRFSLWVEGKPSFLISMAHVPLPTTLSFDILIHSQFCCQTPFFLPSSNITHPTLFLTLV
ncbi:MAG: hypothetical protein BYD32DRAFT_289807 [Podila humilis]|nr:MAG: hypothetical protein BYD32DRAFT_289807 [Podila humilis]